MLTIAEIRRARLEQLITRYEGTVANLNEALGLERTSAKLSRIRNANTRNEREGKTYQMGDALAREIEDKLNLERGWMDSPPGYELMANTRIQHVLKVMESMPEYKIDQAIKIIDTIAEPTPRRSNGD